MIVRARGFMSGPMKNASLMRRPGSLTIEMMIIAIDYELARPWPSRTILRRSLSTITRRSLNSAVIDLELQRH